MCGIIGYKRVYRGKKGVHLESFYWTYMILSLILIIAYTHEHIWSLFAPSTPIVILYCYTCTSQVVVI